MKYSGPDTGTAMAQGLSSELEPEIDRIRPSWPALDGKLVVELDEMLRFYAHHYSALMDLLGQGKQIGKSFSGGIVAIFEPLCRAIRSKFLRKPFLPPDLQSNKKEIQGLARRTSETKRLAVGDFYDFIYRDGFNDERRLRIKVREIRKASASSYNTTYAAGVLVFTNHAPFAVVVLEFPTTKDCVQVGESAQKSDDKFFLQEAPYLSELAYSAYAIETSDYSFNFLQVFVSHIDTSTDRVDLRIFALVATLTSPQTFDHS